jgi:hypothetical protein
MRRVGAEQLRTLAGSLRKVRKKLRLSPVVLSPDDLATCADTFAVELAEIQDRRIVLHGEDPVADIDIRPEHLRLQIEHELRGKLSRLRQSYLRDAGNPRAVARLMTNSLGSFLTLFAALLRLRGKTPAPERAALVEQVADLGVDSDVWQHLLAARIGDTRIATAEAHAIFERYLEAIESVVNAADLGQGR